MSKHVGRRGTLALAKESSRGTGTLTNALWVPRSTISFDDKVTEAREDEGMGVLADSDSKFVVSRMGEGEFESNLDDKSLGVILSSIIGTSPVTTGGPTYSHAYTLNNSNQHQSLSVFYQDPDVARLFSLGVVDSLKITVEQDAIVMFTVGFKSKVGKDYTLQTANFTALGNKFLHQHLQFRTADTVGALSGASAISVKKFEVTISANTKFDTVLGTVDPEDILGQQFSVEGTIELNKEDETYRNYMLNGTYKSAELKFVRAANSQLQMQFPRVDFSEWEQDRTLNEIVSQTINFKGNYDAANALDIISTCVLTNTYAGTAY